jgi:hypothetical protein
VVAAESLLVIAVDVVQAARLRPNRASRFELACDRVRVQPGVRTGVPLDRQGRQPFLRGPLWSATTATASSSYTIWRTPLTG